MTFEKGREQINAEYTIRECATFAEFEACLQIQRLVWQFDPLDITPLRSLVINRSSGGFTLGAFSEPGKLVGFVHALPAFDKKLRPYYHSQMLAVEPVLQNKGIGVMLKLAQRERAMQLGIPLMTWTFDPLQSRNAYLNISKLGGVIRRYLVNHYGNHSTSALHRGLDTDRLIIEWWVESSRVRDKLAGIRLTEKPVESVEIPRNIGEIKERDLAEARDWQMKIRGQFQEHLNKGLYCAGFEVDEVGGNSRYLFFNDNHSEQA